MELDRTTIAARTLRVSIQARGGRNRGRETVLNEVRGVAHVKAAEQEHGLFDAYRAQFESLFDGGDAEPIRAALGQTLGHRDGAVAVSVRFDDWHDFPRARELPHALIVPAQSREGDLDPGWAEKFVSRKIHGPVSRNVRTP